jgi:rhodanese-related sulfurtransferase
MTGARTPTPTPKAKRVAGGLAAAALAALAATAALAADTPPRLDGVKVVSAEEVHTLLKNGARLYDLRRKGSYVERRLPGALHLKFDEKSAKAVNYDASMDTFDPGQLPPDRDALIILHSHGVDGWKGYKAAAAAVKAGYRNVHWFRGGFAEWVAKGLPTE